MAIFGIDKPVKQGAIDALNAARAMGGVLDALNQSLHEELPSRLDMGIGIHTGPAILGRIGAAGGSDTGRRITALGDTVNTASRLESACKELAVQTVVSKSVIAAAELMPSDALEEKSIDIRGRTQALEIYAIKRATQIPLAAGQPEPAKR